MRILYSHSKYLHRVLFFALVFEAAGGEGLVVVIGVGQQGVVKSCCVLLYSGKYHLRVFTAFLIPGPSSSQRDEGPV